MPYSDIQKMQACELVKQHKGVIDEAILDEIRREIDEPKLPKMTVWRWWKHYQIVAGQPVEEPKAPGKTDGYVGVTFPSASSDVTDVTGESLDDKLERAAHKLIDHALRDELLLWTSSKDAISAATEAIKTMRLLRGMPTEILAVLPELVEVIRRKGYDPAQAIKTMHNQFAALPDAPAPLTDVHGVN